VFSGDHGRRAINVQLARQLCGAGAAAVVAVSGLLGLDVSVDGPGDPLVRPAHLVPVDQRRPFAVVAHPNHEVPKPGPRGGESVAGVPQVMDVQPFGPRSSAPRAAIRSAC
jgi:hypothetical protein